MVKTTWWAFVHQWTRAPDRTAERQVVSCSTTQPCHRVVALVCRYEPSDNREVSKRRGGTTPDAIVAARRIALSRVGHTQAARG